MSTSYRIDGGEKISFAFLYSKKKETERENENNVRLMSIPVQYDKLNLKNPENFNDNES